MSAIVSDPTSLTKDKLKNELSKFDVDLPSSDAKKYVYVELYRKHVLKETDFSSDEDLSPKPRKKKPGSPKKSLSKKSSKMEVGSIIISELSDKELASLLKEHGVSAGPIVATTRKIYEKRLQKLLIASEKSEPTPEPITAEPVLEDITQQESQNTGDTVDIGELNFSDSDIEIVPPAIELEEQTESIRRRTAHSSPGRSSRRLQQQQEESAPPPYQDLARRSTRSVGHTVEKTRTEISENSAISSTSKVSTSATVLASEKTVAAATEKPKKRGLSIWIQIALFIIVALIIFFVIQNLEPASQNPMKNVDSTKL